jgi:hypothetical protein
MSMHLLQWVATAIGYLVVIGGAVSASVRFGLWIFDEIQKRRQTAAQGYKIPPRTLTVVLQQQGEYWWHMGGVCQDPAMQIVGHFTVTNIYSRPVRAVQIELRYGLFGRKTIIGDLSISQSLNSNHYDAFAIPPGDTRNASCHIWLYPPVAEQHQPFTAHSVIITDHFGNRHKVKNVSFEYK